MYRRQFLATATTASVGLAGCLGDSDDIDAGRVEVDATGASDSTYENGEVVEFDGGTMKVTMTGVQRSIVSPLADNRIYEPENGQFLIAQVRENETDLYKNRQRLRLRFGTDISVPVSELPRRVYLSDTEEKIAFGVPIKDIALAWITIIDVGRPKWRVPDDMIALFETAPAFRLREASLHAPEDETELSLRVENVGDRAGVFRAVTRNSETESQPVRVSLDAGTSTTVSVSNDIVAGWSPDAEFGHSIESDTREFSVAQPDN